jgi:hypothetical protein
VGETFAPSPSPPPSYAYDGNHKNNAKALTKAFVNVHGFLFKASVNIVRFYPKFDFADKLCWKSSTPVFMQICPVGVQFLHVDTKADGWTNTTKSLFATALRTHLKTNSITTALFSFLFQRVHIYHRVCSACPIHLHSEFNCFLSTNLLLLIICAQYMMSPSNGRNPSSP